MPSVLQDKAVSTEVVVHTRRRVVVLLCFLAVLMLGVEAASRFLHTHRVKTLKMEQGVNDALAIRPKPDVTQVLIAGNSLVYDGIDKEALQNSIGSGYLVHTAGITGSSSYDWQYGLEALLERGSKPDVVVFAVSPSQLLRGPVATSLPVNRLWQFRQLWNYRRDEHASIIEMSDMLLEHYSVFFYLRDVIRIYVRKVIPGFEGFANDWLAKAPDAAKRPDLIPADVQKTLTSRLEKIAEPCLKRGVKFYFLIIPTHQADDSAVEPILVSVAKELSIPVISPIGEMEEPIADYKADGYHLTDQGAVKFSGVVGQDLKRVLAGR